MRIYRRFYLLLAGLFFSGLGFSQKFSGYFISTKGDSVAVYFPNYRQWNENPKSIAAVTQAGEAVVLSSDNASKIVISGYDTYISKNFERLLNQTEMKFDQFALPEQDSLERLNAFLLLVTEANGYKLFQYKDAIRENFFIEDQGGNFSELKFKISYANSSLNVIKDETFKRQLQVIFIRQITENPQLINQLQHLRYQENELKKFVTLAATGSTKIEKDKQRFPSELFVLGGLAYNTFRIEPGLESVAYTNARFESRMAPVVGLGITIFQQRNLGRNYFRLWTKYYQYSNIGTYKGYGGNEEKISFEAKLLNTYFGMGRKWVQARNFYWHTDLAMAMIAFLNNKEIRHAGGQETNGQRVGLNFNVHTGIALKNGFGFWLNSNILPVNVSKYMLFGTMHRSLQTGVSYNFAKNKLK